MTDSGVTATTVTDPGGLEAALLHALTELPHSDPTSRGAEASGGTRRLWTIPGRVPEFIGRNDILTAHDIVARADRRAVMGAITGMGGVGKTVTAIEYAHRHRIAFDIAWWVPAEDPTLIPARLAELAHGLNLASPAEPVGVALGRLRAALAERDRWLLVFDNAEDPSKLAEFLPDGPGHILITSLNPRMAGNPYRRGRRVQSRGVEVPAVAAGRCLEARQAASVARWHSQARGSASAPTSNRADLGEGGLIWRIQSPGSRQVRLHGLDPPLHERSTTHRLDSK